MVNDTIQNHLLGAPREFIVDKGVKIDNFLFYWNRALWAVDENIENAIYLEWPLGETFAVEYSDREGHYRWMLKYPNLHYVGTKSIDIENPAFPNITTLKHLAIEIDPHKKQIKTNVYVESTKYWKGKREFIEAFKWEKQINYDTGIVVIHSSVKSQHIPVFIPTPPQYLQLAPKAQRLLQEFVNWWNRIRIKGG